jgi:predicted anti-sigma-YlaC factor YlaD
LSAKFFCLPVIAWPDEALVRKRFRESRWVAWNLVRVATATPAFGLLAWALVLYGRATA